MKKTSRYSHWNHFLFPTNRAFSKFSKRPLSIKSLFPIRDCNNNVASLIIHTDNNQEGKDDNIEYSNKSVNDLSRIVPQDMHEKDLVIFKINQCLINPYKKVNEVFEPIYYGHVIAGLFRIEHHNRKLYLYPNSTISKVRKGIEDHEFIYYNRFFYSKKLADDARGKGSKEFFWIIPLDKLGLTRQTFIMRCQHLRSSPGIFHLYKSACGQSIYTLITDQQAPAVKSPQTATVQAVLDVISSNDFVFNSNLRNLLIESGLSKFADELGREYLDSISHSHTQSRS